MGGRRNDSEDSPDAKEDAIDEPENHVDASSLSAEDIKLERIVALPTWREMLLDLVAQKRLDPWNIDIVEITTGYIERMRKMEMLDLRVPANLILAAAILIRFKSDALRFEEETQVVEEQVYVEEEGESTVIPVLELKTRIPPKRMVTLDELMLAMEKVFEEQKKREEKASRIEIPPALAIELPELDIEERMGSVYERVLQERDAMGLATFSSLLSEKTPKDIIETLLPLLHLVQDERLSIFQERFFGEIFIRVKGDAEGKGREADGKEE